MTASLQRVGAVAIGRNEGDRLRACLESLRSQLAFIVYVDSGSDDDSVKLANELRVQVVSLNMEMPFTAGRARNAGFERLLADHPQLDFVQFIDGDCVIEADWLETAVTKLDETPDIAAVCGRRREMRPEASIFNRMIDFEWDTPIGEASATGGDFLIRASCFRNVNGFDESVIAGEEPELGYRLRESGWKLARIDCEMTRHDANLLHFSSWWRREIRSGYGGLDVDRRTAGDENSYFRKQVKSAWFWGLAWILGALAMIVIGALTYGAVGVAVVLCIWASLTSIQVLRVSRNYTRQDLPRRVSVLVAALVMLGKVPQVVGQLGWYRDRWLGRKSAIIEYKLATYQPATQER